jgi:hypothetical protein
VARQDHPAVLDVLTDQQPRVLQRRFELLEHEFSFKLPGRAEIAVTARDVKGLVGLHGNGKADQLGPHGVPGRGLGVDGKQGRGLQPLDQRRKLAGIEDRPVILAAEIRRLRQVCCAAANRFLNSADSAGTSGLTLSASTPPTGRPCGWPPATAQIRPGP